MELNKNQARAVELRDKNILVSAGAGAGKTAVLVRRILGLLRETEIDAFLVLTFTKDAAAEMKRRIETSLMAQSADSNLSREERMHLKKQSSKVDDAHIQTFHAFCSDILKEYFQESGVDPNFVVLTDTERNLMLDEAYETAVSKCLERGLSPHLFAKYESRIGSTESVKRMVLQMIAFAESEQSFEIALENGLKFMEEGLSAGVKEQLRVLVQEICRIRIARVECRDLPYYERLLSEECALPLGVRKLFGENYENLLDIVATAKSFGEIAYRNKTVKLALFDGDPVDERRWGAKVYRDPDKLKEDANAFAGSISKELKRIVKLKTDAEDYLENPREAVDYTGMVEELKTLAELAMETKLLFAEAKSRRNALDFSDQEHFALTLLQSNEHVRNELRSRFSYIFVDENQDSSGIQELILNAIKREHNLFKVGDLKQSIYDFRNADPKIFRGALEQAEDLGDEVIKLEENYRTRKEVLDFVNTVFAEQMPELYAFGSLEAAGGHPPLAEGISAVEYHTYPRKPSARSTDAAPPSVYGIREEDSNATRAAKTVAKKVLELMDSPVAERDASGNVSYRPCRYSDIVILLRNRSGCISDIPDVFREYGIPVEVQGGRGFFDRGEIVSTLAMLKAVVNPYNDVEFVGALLSPYFSFSANEVMELAEYRIQGQHTYFYDACKAYISESLESASKFSEALKTLERLRMRSKYMAFDELIWQVYQVGGFYDRLYDEQRRFHLRFFASKLGDPRRLSLSEFLETIDISSEVQSEFTGMDAVRVMTIHKSKGMEFTNVILVDVNSPFSKKSTSGSLLMSRSAGFSVQKQLGTGTSKSKASVEEEDFLRTLVISCIESEQYDEELRVLYVGMTRAKERLIFVGADKNSNDSYGQIIQNYILPTPIREVSNVVSEEVKKDPADNESVVPLSKEENVLIPVEKVVEARVPNFLAPINIGIERGREVHYLLETFDFERLLHAGTVEEESDQKRSAEEQEKHGQSSPIVWTGNPMADQFLNSSFALRIAKADEIFREEDYVLFDEWGKTQGVIDLFFVEQGEIVLVDYKTDYYSGEQRLSELVERYTPQLKRYKKVLERQYGKKVKEIYICFLSGSGVQRRIDGI